MVIDPKVYVNDAEVPVTTQEPTVVEQLEELSKVTVVPPLEIGLLPIGRYCPVNRSERARTIPLITASLSS